MSGAAVAKRYEELGLAEALGRPYDYPAACHELGLILRLAYSKIPKGLQSLVFRDTLFAFRRLAEVQTSYGMSSANILLQAAEATLPKQKKTLAASEFKHAVVAHKRHHKARQDGGPLQLPQDVLIHIFSFLDMRSLVTASFVCWAWKSAASDNMLWQLQYFLLFGKYDICCSSKEHTHKLVQHNKDIALHQSLEGVNATSSINWREAFKRTYIGNPSWRFTSNRALCGQCESIIWLSNMTCIMSHHCPERKSKKFKIKPIPSYKVVEYLLGETALTMSSSDEDSDSDSGGSSSFALRLRKLWAFPRLVSTGEQPSQI